MALAKIWTIAYRDLGRNRRRTIFSLIAVAMGLALLLVLHGYIAGIMDDTLENNIRLLTGHVQVQAASYDTDKVSLQWPDLLNNPETIVAQAAAMPQVEAAAQVLWATGILSTIDDSSGVRITGMDTASPLNQHVRDGMVAGDFLAADDRGGVLLGQRLADSFGVTVGDRVSLTLVDGEGEPDEGIFDVRGLFSTGVVTYDENTVFLPISRAQAFARAGNRASAVVILLHNKDDADGVAAALSSPGVIAKTWEVLNQVFLQAFETGLAFYVILDAIVMLVVAVIIANTLLMAVFERIREMGILAALGMKGRQIMLMFLMEASVLALAGIALGIVLGALGVAYLARVGIDAGATANAMENMAMGSTMYARFVPRNFFNLSFWTLVVVLLGSLYPAWYAAHLEPTDALHLS